MANANPTIYKANEIKNKANTTMANANPTIYKTNEIKNKANTTKSKPNATMYKANEIKYKTNTETKPNATKKNYMYCLDQNVCPFWEKKKMG